MLCSKMLACRMELLSRQSELRNGKIKDVLIKIKELDDKPREREGPNKAGKA